MSVFPVDNDDIDRIEKYRREFNTSVLTIFFTDIKDSTKLREELGDKSYTELLNKHDSILIPLVSKYNGLHIKNIGDSILVVFLQPSDAVECAIAIQNEIYNASLIRQFLKVRIGIDMGQVAREQTGGILKDIFGRFVNRAARIEGLADGGHIFCSESVQDNAIGWIDSSKIKWQDHGFHHVKGVGKALKIWEPFNANIMEKASLSKKERTKKRISSSGNKNNIVEPEKNGRSKNDRCFIAQLMLNEISIKIYSGNLTDFKTDILVSSDDTYLSMGGGVSMSLLLAGGKSIFNEVKKNIPVKYGDVFVTSAGTLSSENIFHCAVIDYSQHLPPTNEVIREVVDKCIQKTEQFKLKSIAFPLLGTGTGGLSKIFSLETILTQLIKILPRNIKYIKEVIIVTFDYNHNINNTLKIISKKHRVKLILPLQIVTVQFPS